MHQAELYDPHDIFSFRIPDDTTINGKHHDTRNTDQNVCKYLWDEIGNQRFIYQKITRKEKRTDERARNYNQVTTEDYPSGGKIFEN